MANEEPKERNIGHVLQSAYDLFLENGIDNTTKEMLVHASGLSRSSVERSLTEHYIKTMLMRYEANFLSECEKLHCIS